MQIVHLGYSNFYKYLHIAYILFSSNFSLNNLIKL